MDIEWINGHVLIDDEGVRVLVDTGSPRSVGLLERWAFQGAPVPLVATSQGVTAEAMSQHLGSRVDVLLGMDFLGKRTFQINLPGRAFDILGASETLPPGRMAPLKLVSGLPTIDAVVGGTPIRMLFDTGSKLSYLTDQLISNHTTVGRVRDFHPITGPFQSDLRLVSTTMGKAKVTLRCGTLPAMLEAGFRARGIGGIVGNDLLEQFIVTAVMPHQIILTSV